MAGHLGIYGGLTPEHWEFIHYLRRKFIVGKNSPAGCLRLRGQSSQTQQTPLSLSHGVYPGGMQDCRNQLSIHVRKQSLADV
jgi:hypothetical protein